MNKYYSKASNVLLDIKKIKQDIKNHSMSPYYLIYGDEKYLVLDLKNTFIDSFSKNFMFSISLFNEDNFDIKKIEEKILQCSLFDNLKLIIFDSLCLFDIKSKYNIDKLNNIISNNNNDNNIILFIEDKIDKRSKLYKTILEKEKVNICECKIQNEDILIKFINSKLAESKKKFENEDTLLYFLHFTGIDLFNIRNEIDKIINYTKDNYIITKDDVDSITYQLQEEKIFKMIDCINMKDYKMAVALYSDLVYNNVPVEVIIALMKRNYLQIFKVKELKSSHRSLDYIAKSLKLQNWQVNSLIDKEQYYNEEILIDKIKTVTNIDTNIKIGKLNRDIAFEMLFD